MFLQHTLRSVERYFFEPRHSALPIELAVIPQGVLADIH
jgi:hypothetical protein